MAMSTFQFASYLVYCNGLGLPLVSNLADGCGVIGSGTTFHIYNNLAFCNGLGRLQQ